MCLALPTYSPASTIHLCTLQICLASKYIIKMLLNHKHSASLACVILGILHHFYFNVLKCNTSL